MIKKGFKKMRKGLLIADLHIKAQDYMQTYKEYKFLEKYLENKTYDFCIILGDFFDRKIYSYEDYIQLSYKYMILLMSHCKKIRVVYGTRSHENDQYNIFDMATKDIYKLAPSSFSIDYKVIKHVEEEELFPDMNVLYVPEEYVLDKKEYYSSYLGTKKYDYIFGHGVIQEVMSNAVRHSDKKTNKIKNHKKPPVFTTAELKESCKGQTFFGHYHIHTNIDNKIFYVGSFSRFCFGEEESKGFYEIQTDGKNYESNFVKNLEARTFITKRYGYKDKIFSSEENLMKEINSIQKRKEVAGIDYLRLVFNIPEDYENSEFMINLLNEKFKFSDDIKIEVVNGYIEKKRQANKEQVKEIFKNYDIIFEKDIPLENKISYFIKEKNEKEIIPENVKKYLSFKAIELLKD